MKSPKEKNSVLVKSVAQELGFAFCGISKAKFLEEEADRLESWLKRGMQGSMSYMGNHFEKRLDPTKLVPGAKSVISLLYNYYPQEEVQNEENYKISRYAYGKDYHFVIKDKLRILINRLEEHIGQFEGRLFVDSAPVMERVWAKNSGLGWVGKNTLLINKQQGSYFFLAEVISDLELREDGPIQDYCGTCTKCLDACPTDAFTKPYELDASKCISYLTIELKNEIPSEFKGKMEDWIFGCDICQEVCPWNRFSKPHSEPEFQPSETLKEFSKKDWHEMTEEVFQKTFKGSPVKRTKYTGLKRNINFVSS